MDINALATMARDIVAAGDHLRPTAARRLVEVQPGLSILRERERTAFESMLYEPTFCLILQGRKQTTFGDTTYASSAGQCLVISHDIAVDARVVEAPYMSLLMRLDVGLLRSLADDVAAAGFAHDAGATMTVKPAAPELLDALGRLLSSTSSSISSSSSSSSSSSAAMVQASVLAPLVVKELHYRLLLAPCGGMLRRMALHDPSASAVARAVAHIKKHFRDDIGVPQLTKLAGMSASSFHRHFKAVMASTPLQYQKDLRLLEARRLITQQGMAITAAAFDVGYESPSQFTREYGRKFGVAPSRDVARDAVVVSSSTAA
ncbi:MAG TPA: AraC family transcriptional regulator [Myxococcota bacterium]